MAEPKLQWEQAIERLEKRCARIEAAISGMLDRDMARLHSSEDQSKAQEERDKIEKILRETGE